MEKVIYMPEKIGQIQLVIIYLEIGTSIYNSKYKFGVNVHTYS